MQNKLAVVTKEDLTLVSENSLNEKQLDLILKKTPQQYVKQRPAKGGGTWEYVTGGYVKKCLNLMFGWDWDFEIVDEKILIESGEIVVKGKLTCRTAGKEITKMQYGNKDIVFKKGTKIPLSIGNDMKSAATDCLKKCASEIGIASDIYNKEDFREVRVVKSEIKLADIVEIYEVKRDKISDEDQMYIDRIIEEKEVNSYTKVYKKLKTL